MYNLYHEDFPIQNYQLRYRLLDELSSSKNEQDIDIVIEKTWNIFQVYPYDCFVHFVDLV